jgi:hypothetical protein
MGIYQSNDPADSGDINKNACGINLNSMITQFEKLT